MTTKVYAENSFNLADDLHGGGTVTVQHDALENRQCAGSLKWTLDLQDRWLSAAVKPTVGKCRLSFRPAPEASSAPSTKSPGSDSRVALRPWIFHGLISDGFHRNQAAYPIGRSTRMTTHPEARAHDDQGLRGEHLQPRR
jgi:hypothetical protein